jgi:hypothetical protein
LSQGADFQPLAELSPSGGVDRSSVSLVLSNPFTLGMAVVGQWSLADLLWVYWGQSVGSAASTGNEFAC